MIFGKERNKYPANYYCCYTKPEDKHQLDWWIFGFVVITTIATGAAAWATWGQWDTASDQERRTLRPYVYVESAGVQLNGDGLTANIQLKNAGQTPAYNLSSWKEAKIDIGPQIIPLIENIEVTKSLVGPQGFNIITMTARFTEKSPLIIEGLQDGRFIYYIWGEIEFRDAFDNDWCVKFSFKSIKHEDGKLLLGAMSSGNEEEKGLCDKAHWRGSWRSSEKPPE